MTVDETGELIKFIYEVSATEVYEVEKDPQGKYVAKRKDVPLEIFLIKVEVQSPDERIRPPAQIPIIKSSIPK